MRKHGLAVGAMDPIDGASELRPARRYEGAPPGTEVTAECIAGIAHMSLFHQEAGEMAAADCGGWAGMTRGARQAAGNAQSVELRCDACGTFATRAADRRQSVGKLGGMRIDVQADDMHGLVIPHGRYFDPGNQSDPEYRRRNCGFGKAAGFVMVCQREQAYASRRGPLNKLGGREHSVGIRGVGVQIDTQGMHYWAKWTCIIAKPPFRMNFYPGGILMEDKSMEAATTLPGSAKTPFRMAFALALAALAGLAHGAACETRSTAGRVAVLELYTSEGCNSCPPADRWVSALPARGFDTDRVVALAFHVDYWDQLGWPDRMAKAQFSARQRMLAQRNHASVVYTPQLLLNGMDYRSTSDTRFGERVKELNRLPPAADLLLRQRPGATDVAVELDVQVRQAAAGSRAQTFLAITENHLQSAIKAGENRGKLLQHDFVVREFSGPLPADAAGRVHWNSNIALRGDWKRPDLALVAFVQDQRSGEILQALHAPLCPNP